MSENFALSHLWSLVFGAVNEFLIFSLSASIHFQGSFDFVSI